MTNYDLAIIGAGPGGYVAAIAAARQGLKTALIEGSEVGGVCLNRGCIPTKSIIASSRRLTSIQEAQSLGISVEGSIKADLHAIISRKNNVVSGLVKGIYQLVSAHKIELIRGFARFNSDRSLSINSRQWTATNVIIATGSKTRLIPGISIDGDRFITSDEIINLTEVPPVLIIIGGGIIGCEFASIFRALGSQVTIIEAQNQILPMEDEATGKALARIFEKQGIKVMTSVTVATHNQAGKKVDLSLSNGSTLEADKVLVAIGREPLWDGLDIEKIGLATEKGAIVTDEKMRTNVAGVYAVGDVNGKYMLAHAASEEGIIAVDTLLGKETVMNYNAVPRPVYTDPEVSCVGRTAKTLEKEGINYKTGKWSYRALPKALCDGSTEGQIIVYADAHDHKIVGAQIVGKHATELTSELTLAIRMGMTTEVLSRTIHSHPTFSEGLKEAVEDSESHAIHKVYR